MQMHVICLFIFPFVFLNLAPFQTWNDLLFIIWKLFSFPHFSFNFSKWRTMKNSTMERRKEEYFSSLLSNEHLKKVTNVVRYWKFSFLRSLVFSFFFFFLCSSMKRTASIIEEAKNEKKREKEQRKRKNSLKFNRVANEQKTSLRLNVITLVNAKVRREISTYSFVRSFTLNFSFDLIRMKQFFFQFIFRFRWWRNRKMIEAFFRSQQS